MTARSHQADSARFFSYSYLAIPGSNRSITLQWPSPRHQLTRSRPLSPAASPATGLPSLEATAWRSRSGSGSGSGRRRSGRGGRGAGSGGRGRGRGGRRRGSRWGGRGATPWRRSGKMWWGGWWSSWTRAAWHDAPRSPALGAGSRPTTASGHLRFGSVRAFHCPLALAPLYFGRLMACAFARASQ